MPVVLEKFYFDDVARMKSGNRLHGMCCWYLINRYIINRNFVLSCYCASFRIDPVRYCLRVEKLQHVPGLNPTKDWDFSVIIGLANNLIILLNKEYC